MREKNHHRVFHVNLHAFAAPVVTNQDTTKVQVTTAHSVPTCLDRSRRIRRGSAGHTAFAYGDRCGHSIISRDSSAPEGSNSRCRPAVLVARHASPRLITRLITRRRTPELAGRAEGRPQPGAAKGPAARFRRATDIGGECRSGRWGTGATPVYEARRVPARAPARARAPWELILGYVIRIVIYRRLSPGRDSRFMTPA